MSSDVVGRGQYAAVRPRPNGLVVAWVPYAARSAELARALDVPCHFIHALAFQRPLLAPVKYPLQALRTWKLLWRERPRAVVVQNPPLPAILCVALYSRLAGARFIVDTHSGALILDKWAWSRPAQRWIGRHAVATLVHTASVLPQLGAAGRVLVVEDPPPTFPHAVRYEARSSPLHVVVIGSLSGDEPLEAILAAAAGMTDVQFSLTGNPAHASTRHRPLLHALPSNVQLAGWLNLADYATLVRSANVALSLTTLDCTVLRGAWEAIYAGLPLVTSDKPALRGCFTQGTVFVAPDAGSIGAGLRSALQYETTLRAGALRLRAEKYRTWNEALETVRDLLNLPGAAAMAV